jgi:hypothetical protein
MEQRSSFLADKAQRSGFFYCEECRLFWFGRPDLSEDTCPNAPHDKRRPAQVAVLCRVCDVFVTADNFAQHVSCLS